MSRSMKQVDILLATYNGRTYLPELLDSLVGQSHSYFRIIVCDDCSTDGTFEWLQEWKNSASVPMELHRNPGNLGVIRTFSKLMEFSRAPYVMFCDQDDVWKQDKIEVTLAAMVEAEEQTGAAPVLVHTDLEVVDSNLERMHASYWKFAGIHPEKTTTLNRLLVQNVVTGCTAMMNRALIEACGPIPHGAIMHDWWVALAAAAFGVIVPLPHKTIYYRQHAANCLGAKKFYSLPSLMQALQRQRSMDLKKRRQSQKFASAYHHMLSDRQLEIVENYTQMPDRFFLTRIALMFRYRYYRQGFARNAAAAFLEVLP